MVTSAAVNEYNSEFYFSEPESKPFTDEDVDDDDDDIQVTTDGGSRSKSRRNIDEVKQKIATESRQLEKSKIVVFATISLCAIVCSIMTYVVLDRDEDADFRAAWDQVANVMMDAAIFYSTSIAVSTDGLSTTITATANSSDETFPFVTIPNFEAVADGARRRSGIEFMFYYPRVERDQLDEWNAYSIANQGWINRSREVALASSTLFTLNPSDYLEGSITPTIYYDPTDPTNDDFQPNSEIIRAPVYNPDGPYYPLWMTSPPPFNPATINFDAYQETSEQLKAVMASRQSVMGGVTDVSFLASTVVTFEDHEAYHLSLVGSVAEDASSTLDHPHTAMFTPVFANVNDRSSSIVGILLSLLPWDRYFINLLPEGARGVTCVLKNTCGQAFSYELNGNAASYLGPGDRHDREYTNTERITEIDANTMDINGNCRYSLNLYASWTFEKRYRSALPLALGLVVAASFIIMIVAFGVYDWFVKRRNDKVVGVAAKTNAIVTDLFPSNVRDRLLTRASMFGGAAFSAAGLRKNDLSSKRIDLNFGREENDDGFKNIVAYKSKPIADVFPEATIMCADISGFTAWSSAREPSQVFTLLETIYKAFDDIAVKRRVFKVETIGDCYVAACGVPDVRSDHAVVMCRFARDCLHRMRDLSRRLEVVLGPETADLAMRFGLHSGPVTAGVLRGEGARFQLFGETMNTASRMESTGQREKIQISQETRNFLVSAGKSAWVIAREDKVHNSMGRSELQTYWLVQGRVAESRGDETTSTSTESITPSDPAQLELDRTERLVKWNAELLLKLLRAIEASRDEMDPIEAPQSFEIEQSPKGNTTLDEVREIIQLRSYDARPKKAPKDIVLSTSVQEEVIRYVRAVSVLYLHGHSFHSFEHASHVALSVSKLLSRMLTPADAPSNSNVEDRSYYLHEHSYGITTDPLIQFACVFAAIIHDADHPGVPNTQFARENRELSDIYRGRSIAEQNSVDLAWALLMSPDFESFQSAIFKTQQEFSRFRQLVVNAVMATDIMDRELKMLRDQRWNRAFSDEQSADGSAAMPEESPKDAVDRKATIVIEHIMQASDVAHTMQHWHVYRKWNERLFREMTKAYADGRAVRDPADSWYKGELGFFDFYIVPLAKKLKDCGVFGVSSDEYLDYAQKNREEWDIRGQEVVAEMVQALKDQHKY